MNHEWVKVDDCKWCIYREEWILDEAAREVADGDYVHVNDFDSYLLGLDRDEVAENCIDCDDDEIEEHLAVWNRYHEKFTLDMFKEQTAALPTHQPEVTVDSTKKAMAAPADLPNPVWFPGNPVVCHA